MLGVGEIDMPRRRQHEDKAEEEVREPQAREHQGYRQPPDDLEAGNGLFPPEPLEGRVALPTP